MVADILHFIGGKRSSGKGDRYGPVYNPATGEQTTQVVLGTVEDLQAAVDASRTAFPGWASTTPLRRSRILSKYKDLLEKNADKLSAIISAEHGKVQSDAGGEVTRGIEVVEFACGAPHLLKGEITENVGTRVDSYSLRQSLGIVAGITPFNFPIMVPMWMFPVALACGNTFILKPSERDPRTR